MPELCISIALVAVGGMLWDAARRWMTLAHGRMLSADKSQTFERALTQLETRVKRMDELFGMATTRISDTQSETNRANARLDEADAKLEALTKTADGAVTSHEMGALYNDLREWRVKAESTFEKLSADIDTRDRAITNVAEEIVVLKQQQTMALAGVANLPKHGFAGRPK
jgi:chromosome segregation ATPase